MLGLRKIVNTGNHGDYFWRQPGANLIELAASYPFTETNRLVLLLLLFRMLPSTLLASDGPPPPYSAPAAGGFAGLPARVEHVAVELGASLAGMTHGRSQRPGVIDFTSERKPVPLSLGTSGSATDAWADSSDSAASVTELAGELRPLTGTAPLPVQPPPLASLEFDAKTGRIIGSLSEFVTRSLQGAKTATRRRGDSGMAQEQVLIQIARVFDESNRLQADANRIQAERLQRRKRELRAQRAKQAADQQANERADRFNRRMAWIGAGTALVGTGLSVLSLYWQLVSTNDQ